MKPINSYFLLTLLCVVYIQDVCDYASQHLPFLFHFSVFHSWYRCTHALLVIFSCSVYFPFKISRGCHILLIMLPRRFNWLFPITFVLLFFFFSFSLKLPRCLQIQYSKYSALKNNVVSSLCFICEENVPHSQP